MENKHLLIIRFSALGDVLMLVPVVEALAKRYPEVKITVVSRPKVESVFRLLPENVSFVGLEPRRYPGVLGLWHLWRKFMKLKPTHVADVHDVLRTKILRFYFRWSDVKMAVIDKERDKRRAFIEAKVKTQQKTPFERYAEVFGQLGFPVEIDPSKPMNGDLVRSLPHIPLPLISASCLRIGIAPFAAHKNKIYPVEKMEEVVKALCKHGHHIFLFGAGGKEKAVLAKWTKLYTGAQSVVSTQPDLAHELKLMSQLDLILTMDSGNMHLAALCGVPVVSIWGATHPLGGFLGWGCKKERIIQCDMDCRPCSTYGKRPCKRGDLACMNNIDPKTVLNHLKL